MIDTFYSFTAAVKKVKINFICNRLSMDSSSTGLVTAALQQVAVKTGLAIHLAELAQQNVLSTTGQFLWLVTKRSSTKWI